jgi:transcription initiation factor TFIID subunit 5
MEAHKSEFMPEHADEILRIQSVVTQDHMKENELVKTWRKNKLVVKMSSYAFELLLAFLQDQNFMTLLSIINQYVSISGMSRSRQRQLEENVSHFDSPKP